MTYRHAGSQPVCAPNSYGGPKADTRLGADLTWPVAAAELGRDANEKHAEDDDFGQAGTLYRDVMDETDREHLVTNIVGHASDGVSSEMQQRVVAYWASVDPHLGARVATGLGALAPGDPGAAWAAELVAGRANRAERRKCLQSPRDAAEREARPPPPGAPVLRVLEA